MGNKKINAYDGVRETYMRTYPQDDLGGKIRQGITFIDVFRDLVLTHEKGIYALLNVSDSMIRERVFKMLVECGLAENYDQVYDAWLNKENKEIENLRQMNDDLNKQILCWIDKLYKAYHIDTGIIQRRISELRHNFKGDIYPVPVDLYQKSDGQKKFQKVDCCSLPFGGEIDLQFGIAEMAAEFMRKWGVILHTDTIKYEFRVRKTGKVIASI